jgi:hypothetical protein
MPAFGLGAAAQSAEGGLFDATGKRASAQLRTARRDAAD